MQRIKVTTVTAQPTPPAFPRFGNQDSEKQSNFYLWQQKHLSHCQKLNSIPDAVV